MRQRRGGSVGRYGLEAVAPVAGNGGAQSAQLTGGFPLVHPAGMLRNPVQELLHHHAVLQLRLPHSVHFHAVFHSLAKDDGRRNIHHFRGLVGLGQSLIQAQVQGRRVHAQAVHTAFAQRGKGKGHVGIVAEGYTVGLELQETVGRLRIRVLKGVFAHKPEGVVQGYKQVRNHERVVVDIGPADVQEPGNLVQGRQEEGIGPLPQEPFSQPAETLFAAFAREVLAQGDDGRGGDGGTVFPKGGEQIRHRRKTGRRQRTAEFLHGVQRKAQAVHRYHRRLHLQGAQPLRDRNLLRNTHFV